MQAIVAALLFQGQPRPGPVWELSPWIDFRPYDWDELRARIEAQTHRRFLKTHLALDGLRLDPDVKYIYVGRDGRDVFMSLWNHYSNYTPESYQRFNSGDFPGEPLPPCPDDIHMLFRDWISRGSFPWERDGYPFWSLFHHVQTWWDRRELPNILFVHYNDLLADLEGETRRVAAFLELRIAADAWAGLVGELSFAAMKANADAYVPRGGRAFRGGSRTFLYQGSNGRWRGVLTPQELAQYEAHVARALSRDCAAWLEHGRHGR
jgi:aryl sulfotransferase